MSFGQVTVQLGMPKDEAIAKLAKVFNVSSAGSENWWSIERKNLAPDVFPHIGNLGFDNGRLVYVLKRQLDGQNWDKATAFVKSLEIILAEFLAAQGNDCAVAASRFEQPAYDQRRVLVQCGDKFLSVDSSHQDEHPEWDGVTIEEGMGFLPKK
jgi:hypothetical protein